jgi:integrase/recombinase XerD
MKNENGFPSLLERFFTQRLIAQRRVSSHTIASYRDTFRLLLQFVEKRLRKPPSGLALTDLDPSLIGAFLDELEKDRANSARSRNLRLTAIRSFHRYAAHEEPAQSGLIQRVLAMPAKAGQTLREEVDRILDPARNRSRPGGARSQHMDRSQGSRGCSRVASLVTVSLSRTTVIWAYAGYSAGSDWKAVPK